MSDTNKQLMQLIQDVAVIGERMNEKNKKIISLQEKTEELEANIKLLENNSFHHAKPYMVCVPSEVWAKIFSPTTKIDE